MAKLLVLLLHKLLYPVDLHLADVDLVLVLRDLDFGLLVDLLLRLCDTVQLHTHVLDLLRLSMVDVGLPCEVFVTLLDLLLGGLILFRHVTLPLLGLSKLNFDVSERILKLGVLNLTEAQHLAILNFGALLALYTQAPAHDPLLLSRQRAHTLEN